VLKKKPPTRQQKWATKNLTTGLCRRCGKKRGKKGTKQMCPDCAERHNAYRRLRNKQKRLLILQEEVGVLTKKKKKA
jgi:hypothetical protein